MSEFFKALEQAERDRRRQQADPASVSAPEPEEDVAEPVPGRTSPVAPATPASTPAAAAPPPRETGPARHMQNGVPVLISLFEPTSVAAEAYRTLRTNLELAPTDRPYRNIAVTSPAAGAGKSTTAANLAVVAAQAGRRVCLVDADFWRPVLHEVFDLPNTEGLTAALEGRMRLPEAAQETGVDNLSVVVSGQHGEGLGHHLFTSERLRPILQDGAGHFDLVIYDTPPVISVAESVHVAALCDGVILVVRYGAVPPAVLRRAVKHIGQVNGRILGVLLNHVNLGGGDDDVYRYYRGYYAEQRKR